MSNVPPPAAQPGPVGGGQQTNPLAIGSLVASLVGLLCGIGSIVGIILGFMARKQIQESGGTQGGEGMATAGIIIGFISLALGIIWYLAIVS